MIDPENELVVENQSISDINNNIELEEVNLLNSMSKSRRTNLCISLEFKRQTNKSRNCFSLTANLRLAKFSRFWDNCNCLRNSSVSPCFDELSNSLNFRRVKLLVLYQNAIVQSNKHF